MARKESIPERIKTTAKDIGFSLALKTADNPRVARAAGNFVAWIENTQPIHAGHLRFAMRTILESSSPTNTADPKEVRKLTSQVIKNYFDQVFEVAQIINHADKPAEEIPWPKCEMPELTQEQEAFFENGGIIYTIHSGNIFAAFPKSMEKIGPGKKIVVLMESQPAPIQKGYETICANLNITPFMVEEANPAILKDLDFDFLLMQGDRRGKANQDVTLFKKPAELSKWIAFLSEKKRKPILPAMVIKKDGHYALVFGNVINPEDFPASKEGQFQITTALAKETEHLLAQDPSSVYLLSKVWKYKKGYPRLPWKGETHTGYLHLHTTRSDGFTRPEDLLSLNVDFIGPADHDRPETGNIIKQYAEEQGVKRPAVLKCVEVTYGPIGFHLLVLIPNSITEEVKIPMFLGFEKTAEFIRKNYPGAKIGLAHPEANFDFLLHPQKYLGAIDFIERPTSHNLPTKPLSDRIINDWHGEGKTLPEVPGSDTHFPPPFGEGWKLKVKIRRHERNSLEEDVFIGIEQDSILPFSDNSVVTRRVPLKMRLEQLDRALIKPIIPVLKEFFRSRRR